MRPAVIGKKREEIKVARDHARSEAREVKERIVADAERIAAEETHWKNGGERLRLLVEEWKAAERIDRPTETALWKRLSAARNAFTKRRKAYFSTIEEQREEARVEKERLVAEAEALSGSTPRDVREHLEARLRKVEEAVLAEESERHRFVTEARARAAQLRASIEHIEQLLGEARTAERDNDVRSAKEALADRRARLEEVEHFLADLS